MDTDRELTEARQSTPTVGAEKPAPRLIRGRYLLQETLGAGGMGTVYKALDRDVVDGRRVGPVQVALKIVNSQKQGGPEAIDAIKHEGSVVFKLRHKNIVEMYSAESDGETWFLTMELIEGETLETVLERYPNGVPDADSLPLITQLCAGLSYAHNEHGIIHSDLKPSNIFVARGKLVKIFDFGIASRVREIGEPATRFDPKRWGALTPAYACLEMWSGISADPRDDVYSLACIVYQLLSGRHPFRDAQGRTKTAVEIFESGMQVPRITSASSAQNAALAHALATQRSERTPTVAQFLTELTRSRPSISTAGLGAAAAALVGAAVLAYTFLSHPSVAPTPAPEPAKRQTPPQNAPQSAPAPAASAATTPRAPAPAAVNTLDPACGGAPSAALLGTLVDGGLKSQSELAFGDAGMRTEARDSLRRTAGCVRALHALGIESVQSRAWLGDATQALAQP